MRKHFFILLAGLLGSVVAFVALYHVCIAPHRQLLRERYPEVAWIKHEFSLSDTEFQRVLQLHEAYLPKCQERCRVIKAQNETLLARLSASKELTPEIRDLLGERAKMRVVCEAEMLQHFMEVSQVMRPSQGERYLAWVERQTLFTMQTMAPSPTYETP